MTKRTTTSSRAAFSLNLPVTPQETFRAALATLGLTGRGFARILAYLAETEPAYRTVERWSMDREPPASVTALLRVLLDAKAGAAALAHERAHQEMLADKLRERGPAMTARRMGGK